MFNVDYSYLRPKKAAWLKRMYDSSFVQKDNLSVWSGANATIFPLRDTREAGILFGRGGVVDENGNYVPLSGINGRIYNSYPFTSPNCSDHKVVYCGYMVNHWGHFLVEAVTRLWYVLEQDPTVEKYVFFLDEGEDRTIKGNYRKFFELLNIWDKVEFINTPTTYREVIVPEISFHCMQYYSPKFLAIFDALAENIVPDPTWETYDKIFFTRSQFAKGNGYEFGMESLDSYFSNNGFATLAPEKLSLDQMIFCIRNAREVASISGSTPHNMLFASTGQKVTILERLVMNDDHQVCINRMRQLNATHIDSNFNVYSVDFCGPYLLGYNHILERYTNSNNMNPPDRFFRSEKYMDRSFCQYMRSYHDNYAYRWFMPGWYSEIADSLYEAYEDNYPRFQDYLDGNKPFLRQQYFQLHYLKIMIKRILRRFCVF